MSEREVCLQLLNGIPDDQLSPVVTILKAIDEMLDDAYCLRLLAECEKDPDEDAISLDDFAKELGIVL